MESEMLSSEVAQFRVRHRCREVELANAYSILICIKKTKQLKISRT